MAKLTNYLVLLAVLGIMIVGCGNERGTIIAPDSTFPGGALSAGIGGAAGVAGFVLPEGATLDSAIFHIYVLTPSNQQVNVHRITDGWEETVVTWNNFGGAFAADIVGSFMADGIGWRSVDVTSLVNGWLGGSYDNHGLLLDQEIVPFPRAIYGSREHYSYQPYLEICYTTSGGSQCEQVLPDADTHINEYRPDDNHGLWETIFTGYGADNDLEKQSLVRFELEVTPQEGCTRTIGYWKTHAGFGPQDDEVTPLLSVWLGDAGGSKSILVADAATAVDVLKMKTYGKPSNGITKLYAQLLGAKLNVASGASGSDVASAIADADAFLAGTDWNDWSGLSGADKDMVLDWKDMLDDYNNGDIGPGHCDDGDMNRQ